MCSVVGRPYDTDFEIDDGQAWELWTWPGVYKGRRMWEQPSIVRPCAVDGPNAGRHEVVNEHELTPAFPVSAVRRVHMYVTLSILTIAPLVIVPSTMSP